MVYDSLVFKFLRAGLQNLSCNWRNLRSVKSDPEIVTTPTDFDCVASLYEKENFKAYQIKFVKHYVCILMLYMHLSNLFQKRSLLRKDTVVTHVYQQLSEVQRPTTAL